VSTPAPAVVVFTRDLRVRDHPALAAAAAGPVVPLFVLDDALLGGPHTGANRVGFLLDALHDLDRSLGRRGAGLVVRRGDWRAEVAGVVRAAGAAAVHVSDDVSGFARNRLDRLAKDLDVPLHRHPGVTVVPPGHLGVGADGHAYQVFTPYHRRWTAVPWRASLPAPNRLQPSAGVDPGRLPRLADLTAGMPSPDRIAGGETEGLARLKAWAADHLAGYDDRRDDLAADATSHISAHLHLGSLSPLEVATRLRNRAGGAAFVRQLCWRDFFAQVLADRPAAAGADLRPRGDRWREDADDLTAWRAGRTGVPVVDAAMRQLAAEGWMPNRARMIVASYLTKDLYLDWRLGAAHFMDLLVDGDVASNQLNWQWVAGTGNDTNAYRVFNPLRQAERFDPTGEYVRRHVPELADLPAPDVHDPSSEQRRERRYPEPIVDHAAAVAEYRARTAIGTRRGAGP
jgi:deoxyribodipyrimidine photo-lyase